MSHLPSRTCYRPSGRIRPLRTLLALVVMSLGSVLAGIVLFRIFEAGYFIPLIWMLAPALIAWLASFSLHVAHCRNRYFAVALAMAFGFGGYLTYFHIDQCVRWQTPWTAVDRLPGYIVFRMQTDRFGVQANQPLHTPLAPAPGIVAWQPAAAARWNVNWFFFVLDSLAVAMVPAIDSGYWAGSPYSERRRRWHSMSTLHFAPAAGQSLERALVKGMVAAWVDGDPDRVGPDQPHYSVTLWFVRNDDRGAPDTSVYLQIGLGAFQLLTWDEVGEMAILFPELQEIAGPARERLAQQALEIEDAPTAGIWPVPADDPARRGAWLSRVLIYGVYWLALFGPPALVFACLIGGLRIVQFLFVPQMPPPNWFVIPVVLSVPVFMQLARFWLNSNNGVPNCLANRLGRRRLVRAFAQRSSSLIQGHEDQALLAVMGPRKVWGAMWAAQAELNRGLLLIDEERGLLLFEGERENYVIPAEAIVSGRVEAVGRSEVNQTSYHAVVLKVQLGEGVWELPFLPLAVTRHANNWRRAMGLLYLVDELCGTEWAEQSSPPPQPLEAAAS